MVGYVVLFIIIGILLLIWMPWYFIRKNNKGASQAAFEEYLKEMNKYDKSYMPHIAQLSNNLDMINYWLKTGNEPAELQEASGAKNKSKVLSSDQMAKWSPSDDEDLLGPNEIAKAMRNPDFVVYDLEPNEFGQDEVQFFYSSDYIDYVYYCATPEALEKKFYKNVLYFTTSKPTQIPVVYPNKYEGAQMLSLYKHPCQAIWFLKNWKKIRNALEIAAEGLPAMEETSLDQFDI